VVTIRAATTDDVGALAAIHAAAVALAYAGIFDAGTPPPTADALVGRWATVLATPRSWVGAAELDGAVAGMIAVRPSPDADADEATGELVGLHVDPSAWSRGLGRALVAGARSEAARLGFRSLRLWVLEANVRARRLYAGQGWRPDGVTKAIAPSVLELRYSLA
jgi:ribosomal protein S18 acetylase RimI-like enzyme